MNAEPSLARTQFNMTQFLGKSKCHNITATQVYLESLFKIYLLEFTMTVWTSAQVPHNWFFQVYIDLLKNIMEAIISIFPINAFPPKETTKDFNL